MALDTVIANHDRNLSSGIALPWSSRLGRLIIGLNLLGLMVLIGGALVLNELRQGLIKARIDDLRTQGQLIANVIDRGATVGEPVPALDRDKAMQLLQLLFIPHGQRARLFDSQGRMLGDSFVVADRVDRADLPPARPRNAIRMQFARPEQQSQARPKVSRALGQEVATALSGRIVAGVRMSESGGRVVSVSIPLQHVQAVLGVLTLEANDVDRIIAAERWSLLPFVLFAVAVTLVSSVLLNHLIARPVLALARAADGVRLSQAKAISLPVLSKRPDEIGDLTRSLESMTEALAERMGAIERFAADVAHEIKNPLTSMGSALDTLDLISDPRARDKLAAILRQDVRRLDRLVTDISNASRLDAELSREGPRPVDLIRLLTDIVSLYDASGPGDVAVVFEPAHDFGLIVVEGQEGPLGQVFRNLIENARSFSPPKSVVMIRLRSLAHFIEVLVEDSGPGIPAENLETVFQRFYTSRPKGTAFGGNSGLGLSIARQITDSHGGRIWAENRKDEAGRCLGARFIVSLPMVRG